MNIMKIGIKIRMTPINSEMVFRKIVDAVKKEKKTNQKNKEVSG